MSMAWGLLLLWLLVPGAEHGLRSLAPLDASNLQVALRSQLVALPNLMQNTGQVPKTCLKLKGGAETLDGYRSSEDSDYIVSDNSDRDETDEEPEGATVPRPSRKAVTSGQELHEEIHGEDAMEIDGTTKRVRSKIRRRSKAAENAKSIAQAIFDDEAEVGDDESAEEADEEEDSRFVDDASDIRDDSEEARQARRKAIRREDDRQGRFDDIIERYDPRVKREREEEETRAFLSDLIGLPIEPESSAFQNIQNLTGAMAECPLIPGPPQLIDWEIDEGPRIEVSRRTRISLTSAVDTQREDQHIVVSCGTYSWKRTIHVRPVILTGPRTVRVYGEVGKETQKLPSGRRIPSATRLIGQWNMTRESFGEMMNATCYHNATKDSAEPGLSSGPGGKIDSTFELIDSSWRFDSCQLRSTAGGCITCSGQTHLHVKDCRVGGVGGEDMAMGGCCISDEGTVAAEGSVFERTMHGGVYATDMAQVCVQRCWFLFNSVCISVEDHSAVLCEFCYSNHTEFGFVSVREGWFQDSGSETEVTLEHCLLDGNLWMGYMRPGQLQLDNCSYGGAEDDMEIVRRKYQAVLQRAREAAVRRGEDTAEIESPDSFTRERLKQEQMHMLALAVSSEASSRRESYARNESLIRQLVQNDPELQSVAEGRLGTREGRETVLDEILPTYQGLIDGLRLC